MGIVGPLAGRWRRARSAVRTALAIAWLGWAVLASALEAGPREVELEIISGEDWAATGIDVRPGDTLAVEAGEAFLHQDPISPGGLPDVASENVVEPRLPYAALIGRIGDGPAFLVGARYEGKAADAGAFRLRWNLLRTPAANLTHHSPPGVYMVKVRHTPAPVPDPDEDDGNSKATDTGENLSVAKSPVEMRAPPRRSNAPGRPRTDPPQAPAPSLFSGVGPWLLGLAVLLLIAAAGLALQRRARARTLERTRALVGLSPSLDLAAGSCLGDDLPAEGPSASLRARLDPGAACLREGSEHG